MCGGTAAAARTDVVSSRLITLCMVAATGIPHRASGWVPGHGWGKGASI